MDTSAKSSKQSLKAKDWYEYAKIDLELALYSYSRRYYPYALFHLQQAVEKAGKGAIVDVGFLWPKEMYNKIDKRFFKKWGLEEFYNLSLKSFTHDWANQLIKRLKKFAKVSLSTFNHIDSSTLKTLKIKQKEYKIIRNYLNNLSFEKLKVKNESETIITLIEKYSIFIKLFERLSSAIAKDLASRVEELLRVLGRKDITRKKAYKILHEIIKKTLIFWLVFGTLSIVLVKYVEARYPDFKEKDRIEESIMIQKFPSIANIINQTISYLEN